jgi:hypothetical protein
MLMEVLEMVPVRLERLFVANEVAGVFLSTATKKAIARTTVRTPARVLMPFLAYCY